MKKSLADELYCAFENIDLSPTYTVEMVESPKASHEGMMMEDIRTAEDMVPEGHEGHSKSPGVANDDPESHIAVKEDGVELHTANNASNAAPNLPPKKSVFIEHLDPNTTSSQPISHKEQTKLMASKHNRELIDRNADGFFKMETMPSITDVKRRLQQSDGIAALQRTLVPAATSNALISNTGSPHVSFSMTPQLGKRSSTLRNVTYAESRAVKARNHHGSPYPSAASRAKNTPRFSLARDLIASGYKKRMAEPSAPARFVRLPTDPVIVFTRNFADCGLKLTIPHQPGSNDEHEEGTERRGRNTTQITSLPTISPKPALDFGTPRAFLADQCIESTCPIRFAHAKGPYHHKGSRTTKIITGLFGHSNPPPEIWNAYRNMIHISSEGRMVSPDGRPGGSCVDEDLVIAFAVLHYGGLNEVSGVVFRRRYAGGHIPSRIAVGAGSVESLTGSVGSWAASLKG